MEIELEIENFPKQKEIFNSPAKYTIVAKGRRFGLTKGAANDFIKSALEGKFKQGLWVDVVITNIERYIERYFLPHLNKLPKELWNWHKQQKMLVIGKSYIDFRSADRPENMEGFGYDKAFLNEAGIILKDEYLWDNAIRPMFWDYPDVRVVIGGTPKGKGKFFELFERGKDATQSSYRSMHFTSFDSPFVHIHEAIRTDIASMPERVVEQEIYAKFLEDTGVVFRNFLKIMDAEPKKPYSDHRYIMGVDLAKVEDFTVITVYDAITNRQVYQARFNKIEWCMQKGKISETARYYYHAQVFIDATGIGEPIVDDLARMGVGVDPIRFTNEQKRQLIEKLSNWIEIERIHIIRMPETITEFSNFTYDISEINDRIRYGAPVGFHDDIVIAHALAVWRLNPIVKEAIDKPKTLIKISYERQLRQNQEAYEGGISERDWNEWNAV